MSLLYSFDVTEDGSYSFISEQNHHYLIYFSESTLPDSDGNIHIVYNLGFSRDGDHSSTPFSFKYDRIIRATIMSIVNDFFNKNDHRVLIYFCFGDEGYSRQRKIVFNQWCGDLDLSVEKHDNVIPYENTFVYGSLMIVRDNPLKQLILTSFNKFLEDIYNK